VIAVIAVGGSLLGTTVDAHDFLAAVAVYLLLAALLAVPAVTPARSRRRRTPTTNCSGWTGSSSVT
jgi:hypothetical protein